MISRPIKRFEYKVIETILTKDIFPVLRSLEELNPAYTRAHQHAPLRRDSIKALKKNTTIVTDSANELYARTKILADISPSTGGAEQAAKEIVNGLFSLFEALFDISSKDLHTKTKNQAPQINMVKIA